MIAALGMVTVYHVFAVLVAVFMVSVFPVIDLAIEIVFPVVKFLTVILFIYILDLMFSLNLTAIVVVFEIPVAPFFGDVEDTWGGVVSIIFTNVKAV